MLYGDGQTHGKYEFRLNEDGSDYDWDHATNVDTEEQITLAPEDGDTDAQAALDAFKQDNNCYTIEDVEGNTVTDPQGILYMTANSASGSKYYELVPTQAVLHCSTQPELASKLLRDHNDRRSVFH